MSAATLPDHSIAVSPSLPAGAVERGGICPRRAVAPAEARYTHCDDCGGWIEGPALAREIAPGDDREHPRWRGTGYYCRRCGKLLGFRGAY